MSGPCDLVARVATAELRSFGVRPVKAEPVKPSAEEAASTASAAYLRAFAIVLWSLRLRIPLSVSGATRRGEVFATAHLRKCLYSTQFVPRELQSKLFELKCIFCPISRRILRRRTALACFPWPTTSTTGMGHCDYSA